MGGAVVGVAGRQFPWQLSLSTGWLGMFYQHRCGAALITRRHALTAAHCLAGRGSWWSLPGAGLYLLAGFRTHQQRDTAAVGRVVRYTLHPQFVSSTYEQVHRLFFLNFLNITFCFQDIAVLELARPFLLSPAVLPVCMPAPSLSRPAHYTSLVGRPAWLSGWGRRWGGGPLASQLQAVLLPVLDNYQCMAWYNGTGLPQVCTDIVPATQHCTGLLPAVHPRLHLPVCGLAGGGAGRLQRGQWRPAGGGARHGRPGRGGGAGQLGGRLR